MLPGDPSRAEAVRSPAIALAAGGWGYGRGLGGLEVGKRPSPMQGVASLGGNSEFADSLLPRARSGPEEARRGQRACATRSSRGPARRLAAPAVGGSALITTGWYGPGGRAGGRGGQVGRLLGRGPRSGSLAWFRPSGRAFAATRARTTPSCPFSAATCSAVDFICRTGDTWRREGRMRWVADASTVRVRSA